MTVVLLLVSCGIWCSVSGNQLRSYVCHTREDIRGHDYRNEYSFLAYCRCLFPALTQVQLLYGIYGKKQNSLQG